MFPYTEEDGLSIYVQSKVRGKSERILIKTVLNVVLAYAPRAARQEIRKKWYTLKPAVPLCHAASPKENHERAKPDNLDLNVFLELACVVARSLILADEEVPGHATVDLVAVSESATNPTGALPENLG